MKLPTKKSKAIRDLKELNTLIYGDPKIGKSTFASQYPDALVLQTEDGYKCMSVYGGDHVYTSWSDFKGTVKELLTTDHQFKTVIVDIVDKAWNLCELYTLKELGIKHESDSQYGRAWTEAVREFKIVINALCSSPKFGVIFVSHYRVHDIEQNGITRKVISNSIKKDEIRDFINGLVYFIFHCHYDDEGNRMIRTKGNVNVHAGDRTGKLPEIMPLSFKSLRKELEKIGWHL